jgi:hypothetical protein
MSTVPAVQSGGQNGTHYFYVQVDNLYIYVLQSYHKDAKLWNNRKKCMVYHLKLGKNIHH